MKVHAFSLRVVYFLILVIIFISKQVNATCTFSEYSLSHCNICMLHCDWYSSSPTFAFWISDDCLLKCVQLRQVYFGSALHLTGTHDTAVYLQILSAFEMFILFAFVPQYCLASLLNSGVLEMFAGSLWGPIITSAPSNFIQSYNTVHCPCSAAEGHSQWSNTTLVWFMWHLKIQYILTNSF